METETEIEEGLEDGRQKCWRRQRVEIEGRRWAARAREIPENYGEMKAKQWGNCLFGAWWHVYRRH